MYHSGWQIHTSQQGWNKFGDVCNAVVAAVIDRRYRKPSGDKAGKSIGMIDHMFQRLRHPAASIVAALALTLGGARLFSLLLPRVHWEPVPGMHIHHYVYGIFILALAGYLALLFRGDRAR